MGYRSKKVVVVVVALGVLVFSLSFSALAQERVDARGQAPAVQAPAGQTTTSGAVTGITFSAAEQAAALAYWNKERIISAQAIEMPRQMGTPEAALDATAAIPTGPAGFASAGAPVANADRLARKDYPREWAEADAAARAQLRELPAWVDSPAAADGTSQTFTSYIINQQAAVQKNFPHRVAGKLTFNTPSGGSSCSASVISGNNVIVTAAHCIYDTPSRNQFYTNFVFTPAYRDGNAPYGTFPAQGCWVLNSWVALSGAYAINTWADDDVAVCKMGNNSAGRTLSSQTGWFGRGWNLGYVQHFHTLGYPVNSTANTPIPNGGKYLRSCQSESFQHTNNVVGTGCDLGPGHSGGAFIVNYKLNEVSGQVRSVYSGYFVGSNNAYGARFTSSNIVPLCTTAGC